MSTDPTVREVQIDLQLIVAALARSGPAPVVLVYAILDGGSRVWASAP